MSALVHRGHSEPGEVVLTQEMWEEFRREYVAEFDFCRILQSDYITVADSLVYKVDFDQAKARALVHYFGAMLDGVSGAMRRIAIATGKLFGHPLNPFLQDKAEERGLTTHNRIYTNYRLIGNFCPAHHWPRCPMNSGTTCMA
jgi:hypothetical protein